MSGGITVKEFKHIPGVNDAEYIKLLKEHDEINKNIIRQAVAEIKRLSAQMREQPEIIRCKDCKYTSGDDYCHCKYVTWWNNQDDYCSRAEKRGEENEQRY